MAVTKRLVDEAMQGSNTLPLQESSFTFPDSTALPTVVPPEQQYVVFMLVKKKQKKLTLDGICHNVINPKTNEPETIWLLRGARSIWGSELVEQLKDKAYLNRNRLSLQFRDGMCRIPVTEKRMLEYARHHQDNVGKNRGGSGKYDFYEYDAAEEQKMRHDARMNRIRLIQVISEMTDDKMVKLALFLGIKPYDDEVGLPRTPDGFRTELLIKADTQPETVLRYINKPEVEISYLIRKGIMEGKIDLGGQTGNIIWAGNAAFICKLPQNRKAIEYLTEFAMTNSNEGRIFKEQLESIVT